MNKAFLRDMDKDIRILEVGANIGNQLGCLRDMGFTNLYGVDVSRKAVEMAKILNPGVHIIPGSALDLPFQDGNFDLVFTSGMLIHINPDDIRRVIGEIYRCSSAYIWGLEYHDMVYQEVPYRVDEVGHSMMWKGPFQAMFCRHGVELKELAYYPYLDGSGNEDAMYLLEKVSG